MIYLFKQKEYQIFLYISCFFNYTDKTKDITYNTEELHVDCTNKLLQEEGKINIHLQTYRHTVILQSVTLWNLQHYNTSNDNDNDDNDNEYYWEHDNSTNKSNVDQAQNDFEIKERIKEMGSNM